MRPTLPLVVLLLVTTPAWAQTTPLQLQGGWALRGHVEPSTSFDREAGFMWAGPDTNVTGRQVYFNGFHTSALSYDTRTIHSATLRTAHTEYPQTRARAVLGVWKDCNADGYIGHGEHGLLEYPAQLLDVAGADRCKPSPPPMKCQGNSPPHVPKLVCWIEYGWIPSHHDGKWVHELIPISWDDTEELGGEVDAYKKDAYPYDLNDTEARVWADWNRPTDGPTTQCHVTPQQAGTWHSTGGILAYGDCQTHFRVVQTQSNVANQSAATRPFALNQNGGAYSGNEYPQRSSSPLNQPNPWGDPSAPAAFTAWDCSNPIVREMTVGEWKVAAQDRWIGVPRPKAPQTSPTPGWSIAGQVNETDNALADCRRDDKATQERGSLGDTMYCPGEGTLLVQGAQGLVCESKTYNTVGPRQRPDAVLLPPLRPMPNGLVDSRVALLMGDPTQPALVPREASLFWTDNFSTSFSRNPFIKKEDLQPRDRTWMTFYAYVSLSKYAWTLPGGAAKVGSYGNEFAGQCGHGYDCDPDHWWPGDSMPRSALLGRDPSTPSTYPPGHPLEGQPLSKDDNQDRPEAPFGAVVGRAYNLRDVDCWDMGAQPPGGPRVSPLALLASGGAPCG